MDGDNLTTIIVALIAGLFSYLAARQAAKAQEARRDAEEDTDTAISEALSVIAEMHRLSAPQRPGQDDDARGTDS